MLLVATGFARPEVGPGRAGRRSGRCASVQPGTMLVAEAVGWSSAMVVLWIGDVHGAAFVAAILRVGSVDVDYQHRLGLIEEESDAGVAILDPVRLWEPILRQQLSNLRLNLDLF